MRPVCHTLSRYVSCPFFFFFSFLHTANGAVNMWVLSKKDRIKWHKFILSEFCSFSLLKKDQKNFHLSSSLSAFDGCVVVSVPLMSFFTLDWCEWWCSKIYLPLVVLCCCCCCWRWTQCWALRWCDCGCWLRWPCAVDGAKSLQVAVADPTLSNCSDVIVVVVAVADVRPSTKRMRLTSR